MLTLTILHKSFKISLDKVVIMHYNEDNKRREAFKMREDTPPEG